MTTETQATAREQSGRCSNDRAAAITTRDAHRAVAHHAPEVVSLPWLRRCATPGTRLATRRVSRAGSATWGGPIGYDIGEPVIEAGDDVAFCHGLTHMTGTKTDGELVDLGSRPRRAPPVGRGWQITHEHDSTPFYMDEAGPGRTLT